MKRTGFKRPKYEAPATAKPKPLTRQVVYSSTSVAVPAPKGEKAKPGKRKPTKQEAEWMDKIVEYGCIACRLDGLPPGPACVHHILRGGRRMGHLFTLPLCQYHHTDSEVSRHPYKARFEKAYGKEMDLLAKLKTDLGVFDKAEYA
jgi:hypothetical protein